MTKPILAIILIAALSVGCSNPNDDLSDRVGALFQEFWATHQEIFESLRHDQSEVRQLLSDTCSEIAEISGIIVARRPGGTAHRVLDTMRVMLSDDDGVMRDESQLQYELLVELTIIAYDLPVPNDTYEQVGQEFEQLVWSTCLAEMPRR